MNINNYKIGVVGAGTMGSGIAQLAATFGMFTFLIDKEPEQLAFAKTNISKSIAKLIEKGKINANSSAEIIDKITFSTDFNVLNESDLVIEAIIEDLNIKQRLFGELENICSNNTIFATNTSSLAVTAIASVLKKPERFVGMHFFNPVPLMKLVEIVPGILTSDTVTEVVYKLAEFWNKIPVIAKDTPGFIVNKIARPYYGEALRIYEEGIADFTTIDWAMKSIGGFRMGPFELMDLIGNDVNFAVTSTVFKQMFYDRRFLPSITQQRYVDAKLYGRKTGKGFYDYNYDAPKVHPNEDKDLGKMIFMRIFSMILNEAADTVHKNIANIQDCDKAMKYGVNYPFGPFEWAEQGNISDAIATLEKLYEKYKEERYRLSPFLLELVK